VPSPSLLDGHRWLRPRLRSSCRDCESDHVLLIATSRRLHLIPAPTWAPKCKKGRVVTPPLGATGSLITTGAEGDAVALRWLSRAAVIAEQTTGSRDQRYSFSDCPAGQVAKLPSGAKISNKAFISSHLSRSKPDLDRPLVFNFF
jgi:hypothetical protein